MGPTGLLNQATIQAVCSTSSKPMDQFSNSRLWMHLRLGTLGMGWRMAFRNNPGHGTVLHISSYSHAPKEESQFGMHLATEAVSNTKESTNQMKSSQPVASSNYSKPWWFLPRFTPLHPDNSKHLMVSSKTA